MIIFHFSDKETEAHRVKITLQGPTRIKRQSWDLKPDYQMGQGLNNCRRPLQQEEKNG